MAEPLSLHLMCPPRTIYVSQQPTDWPWIVANGFVWVINLRSDADNPVIPELYMEKAPPGGLDSQQCPTIEQMDYLNVRFRQLSPTDGSVKGLVHCRTTGRSSTVWAGYFVHAGFTVQQAMDAVETRMEGDHSWYACALPFTQAYYAHYALQQPGQFYCVVCNAGPFSVQADHEAHIYATHPVGPSPPQKGYLKVHAYM